MRKRQRSYQKLGWFLASLLLLAPASVWAKPKLKSIALSQQGSLLGFRIQLSSGNPKVSAWVDNTGQVQWFSMKSKYAELAVLPQGNVLLKSFKPKKGVFSKWGRNNELLAVGGFRLTYTTNRWRVTSISYGRTTYSVKYTNIRMIQFGNSRIGYNFNGTVSHIGGIRFGYNTQGIVLKAATIVLKYNELDWRVLKVGRAQVIYLPANFIVVGMRGRENRTSIKIQACSIAICPSQIQSLTPNRWPGAIPPSNPGRTTP